MFVITSGEPSTPECHRRLDAQTCTFTRSEIRNVTPMFAAFQAMLDRCQTPYYCQIDADMMLDPDAVIRLYEGIRSKGDRCAQYVGWLWDDDVERPIQGVKIYNHAICSRFPYSDSISCEMGQNGAIRSAGYSIDVLPLEGWMADPGRWERTRCCLGVHWASQTPEMAFRRWQRLAQKHRQLPWMGWVAAHFRKLEQAWLDHPKDQILKARYLGIVSGLSGPIPEGELDAAAPNQDYRRLAAYVGEYSDGPKEMTLYVTDRCNFRCSFCKRQKGGIPPKGDMSAGMVSAVLAHYPTLRSCCIAGYGEPLLNGELPEILRLLLDKRIHVGLITNGSLLAENIDNIRGVGYVSVSLNAFNAEDHKAITASDSWDWVLKGIRACKSAGIRTGISYVAHKGNLHTLVGFVDSLRGLNVDFCHIHNLLPHAGVDDPFWRDNVLRADDPEVDVALSIVKAVPGADLVTSWPELITDNPPRRCMSPFIAMGVDARGDGSYCRRIDPPGNSGGVLAPESWFVPVRCETIAACTGDRDNHPACNGCFGSWRG